MTFSNYLKGQLIDFVECYRKYFWKTLGAALTFTVLGFVINAILLKYSMFDTTSGRKQISLLSYFFTRYSNKDIYSLVDLAKTAFVFFIALFSFGLTRLTKQNPDSAEELGFSLFIKQLRGSDILTLLGVLIVCSGIDYGLFRIDSIVQTKMENYGLRIWLHSILFLMRIYIPLYFFTFTQYKLTGSESLKLNLKKIVFIFISLWLFNEFAYEISLFVRAYIFGLVLAPFDEDKKYLYESILGIPLIAFYFLGYHSSMTTSIKQLK